MAIISWDELLDILLLASDRHAPEIKDDLLQLIGFCKEIEKTTFVPFKAEDFGVDVAKSIDRYNMVVDTATDIIMHQSQMPASTKGYRATSIWTGYVRYMNVADVSLGLWVNRDLWKKSTSMETPFWVNLVWKGWKRDDCLYKYIDSLPAYLTDTDNNGVRYIALEAPVGMTLEETGRAIANQVLYYINQLVDFRSKQHTE